MPELSVSRVGGNIVNVSTLTEDQRAALKSDIEEQLGQIVDGFLVRYTPGSATFTLILESPLPNNFEFHDVEDTLDQFNGAVHKVKIAQGSKTRKATRGGKSRRNTKCRSTRCRTTSRARSGK